LLWRLVIHPTIGDEPSKKWGHAVKLIPAQHVTPFVRGNKNDKNDALVIYEASLRSQIRCVPIKSEAQQEI